MRFCRLGRMRRKKHDGERKTSVQALRKAFPENHLRCLRRASARRGARQEKERGKDQGVAARPGATTGNFCAVHASNPPVTLSTCRKPARWKRLEAIELR